MRLLAALTIACSLACAPSPRRVVLNPSQNTGVGGNPSGGGGGGGSGAGVIGGGGGGGGATPAAATGSPVQRLNAVDAHMRQRGFTRVGPAVRNQNMPAGGLVAYAVEAQPGKCYVAVALGADGTDLNLILLDPMGRPAGHDVQPNTNPHVRICPSVAGRHTARLQMASGSGEYYYALYEGAPNAQPELAAVLGGQAASTVQTASIDSNTQGRLSSLDQRLGGQNFRRVGEPMGVQLSRGEDHQRQLNLQQGYCYAFASLGGQGARDTDLYILNGAGETMQQDRSTDVDALVQFCPPASGTYQLRANMYSGNGPLFIAGWVQRQQAQLAGVEPAPTAPVIAESGSAGGLDERYSLLDADIQARGYEAYGDRQRGELQQGQTQSFDLELEGDKCYAIIAVGDNGVRDLDLSLQRGNRTIDQNDGDDARPIVRVCADRSGTYAMQVKMTEGEGAFFYHAYRWPRGTRGPFGLRGLTWVRFAEVTQLLSVENYEPDANFAPGRGQLRRQGASANHTLELPANHCVAVVVVGGDGVIDLDVQLQQNGSAVSADTTRDAMPNVRYCTQGAGRFRLQIQAASGSGDYFYQVFQRSGS